jgi:hypothetical protein
MTELAAPINLTDAGGSREVGRRREKGRKLPPTELTTSVSQLGLMLVA